MTSLPRPFTKQPALNGFSLIEMAIILVIIGLIAGTITPLLVSQIKQEKVSAGRDIVRLARDEIIGSFRVKGYLPKNGTNYTFPDGLGHGNDPWTKQIFYKPLSNATNPNFNICSPGFNLETEGLSVNASNQSSLLNNIAFVVGSDGENYTRDTNLTSPVIHIEPYNRENYDDIIEYITLNHLQSRINCSNNDEDDTDTSNDADISFENNILDFSHIIESAENLINIDQKNKKITMGGSESLESACVWYSGNKNPCNNGICDIGTGFRAYFEFKTTKAESKNSNDYASGFTFAITSDTDSPKHTVCGGDGSHLGYAGTHATVPPNSTYWIGEPKAGIEIDFYKSQGGGSDWCYDKNDGNQNHIATVFWGKAYAHQNNQGDITYLNNDICLNDHNDDDNRHGAGNQDEYNSVNPDNNSVGYHDIKNTSSWLEDAETHSLRIDVKYNKQAQELELKAWIDKTGSEDLTVELSNPNIQASNTISPNIFAQYMETIRFGWTIASSDGQSVKTSNFKIIFLDT